MLINVVASLSVRTVGVLSPIIIVYFFLVNLLFSRDYIRLVSKNLTDDDDDPAAVAEEIWAMCQVQKCKYF